MAIFVVLVHGALAAEATSATVGFGVLEISGLGHGLRGWDVLQSRGGKDVAEGVEGSWVGGPALFRELNRELDVKVAKVVVTVRWHTLAANHLDSTCDDACQYMSEITGLIQGNGRLKLTWRNGLARQNLDAQPPVVKVFDKDSTSSERSHEINLAVVEKVVVLAGEARVGLLLNLEDNVTSHDARGLVTLAAEFDTSAALDTTVDVDVQHLPVDNRLLSVALLAAILVLDELALTVAVGAGSLETLNHGAHLAHHCLHTVTITACAALDGALLASTTLALGADDGALERKLGDLAAVDVLERDLVGVVNSARLGRATARGAAATEHASEATQAAATKELSEQVLSSHATAASSTVQTSLSHLVIGASLLGVAEDFVGVGNLLELVLGFLVTGVLVCGVC